VTYKVHLLAAGGALKAPSAPNWRNISDCSLILSTNKVQETQCKVLEVLEVLDPSHLSAQVAAKLISVRDLNL